jgi:hypothetical protein
MESLFTLHDERTGQQKVKRSAGAVQKNVSFIMKISKAAKF